MNEPEDIHVIERNTEFLMSVKETSEFIKGLPISIEQNNKLVEYLVANIYEAEKYSFEQGFDECLKRLGLHNCFYKEENTLD